MTASPLGADNPRCRDGVRRAVIGATGALAIVLAAVPGQAAPPPVPALLSSVQVQSGTANAAEVKLTKHILVKDLPNLALASATGSGFVTVALVRKGGAGGGASALVFQRVPGEAQTRSALVGQPGATIGLASGAYKLIVIADTPTVATLKLGGLSKGTTKVRAAAPAKGRATMLTVGNTAGVVPSVGEHHDTYTASGELIAIANAEFTLKARQVAEVAACTWETTAPAVGVRCANGVRDEARTIGQPVPSANPGTITYVSAKRFGSGKTVSYGVDYATTGVISTLVRWNTWIEI